MLPDSPVQPQWRPLTPMQPLLPKKLVHMCAHAQILHWIICLSWQMCVDKAVTPLEIPPTTGSSIFNWFNLVKWLQYNNVRRLLQTSSTVSSFGRYSTAFSLTPLMFSGVRWWTYRNNGLLDWWMCWNSSFVFVGAMIRLELVMQPPRLCSVASCRSSSNHDGNCLGQISHTCRIMVTTIVWAQTGLRGVSVWTCVCDRACLHSDCASRSAASPQRLQDLHSVIFAFVCVYLSIKFFD